MTTIQELTSDFTFDCFSPMAKELVALFRSKQFSDLATIFMNAKKYKVKSPESTDDSRFGDLVTELVNAVKTNGSLNKFINNEQFYESLLTFMKNQYDNLSDTFLRGAYPKMIDAFNRIVNPKKAQNDEDDDDTEDPLDELKSHVKNYSPEVNDHLQHFKLYFKEDASKSDDYSNFYSGLMIDFYAKNISAFNIFSNEKSLWCFINDDNLDKTNFTSISVEQFMEYLQKDTYTMNPVHYTTLDTIKRDYSAKSFDLMKIHIKMLQSLNFYEGVYKSNDGLKELNELQVRNTIQGFPSGFDDDVTKNCMAVFKFGGEVGNVKLTSYWITKKPLVDFLNESDRNAFDWKDIDDATLISNIMENSSLGTSCLH